MRWLPLLAVVAVAAGCGADVARPYSAASTKPCLEKAGYRVTTSDAKVGPIAAAAERGGLRADAPGKPKNTLTIAFGADGHDAVAIARFYRRAASAPNAIVSVFFGFPGASARRPPRSAAAAIGPTLASLVVTR